MGRSVILSNGRLAVGLNEKGLVHDFYYPYVGLENLTTARSVHHKIGIWVDGQFSWVDDGDWHHTVDFETDALVSTITMSSEQLGVRLEFNDFIDSEYSAFCRVIKVTNCMEKPRCIRLFMHQVFQISNDGRADTALFIPEDYYILDYKGRCSLLIYGEDNDGNAFDQFSVGNYGIEGKEGTYRDAEDGQLDGGTVEHGGVDSVLRFSSEHQSTQTKTYNYWIVAANAQYSAAAVHERIKKDSLVSRLQTTRTYWHSWLSQGSNQLHQLDGSTINFVKKSLMIIKAHCDKHGGIIASADSSIYNYGRDYYSYVWPRDGAYALWPLIRLGYYEEARRFFNFCKDVMTPEGYMEHKYQPDRAIGSTWHPQVFNNLKELPIQEDETANLIFMISEYLLYSGDDVYVRSLYDHMIKPAADFMARFVDEQTGLPHASYDLWEQKFLTNTYSVAITYQALLAACTMAEGFDRVEDTHLWREAADMMLRNCTVFFNEENGSYRKGYHLQDDGSLKFDDTLDISSVYGVMTYGYFSEETYVQRGFQAIEQTLMNIQPSGGVPRYTGDGYFFDSKPEYYGNPWMITTLWVAQYYVKVGRIDDARQILSWVQGKASPSGMLPEQIHPESSQPVSVMPLVWSHAEFINTVLDISTKLSH